MNKAIVKLSVAGFLFSLASGVALAQGTGNNQPLSPVPEHKPTPSRYMQHPRPVPERVTTDQLNQMSLNAAQNGTSFTPPAPGTEQKKTQ